MERLPEVWGRANTREDLYDKARGKTKYTCDRQIAGMLYAKLVLSEKANADITIRTEKAKQVPGVRAVFTHANVPKIPYNPHNWSACLDAPMDQYILSEKARYVGDHLALVVGETKAAVTVADFPYLKMKVAGANITINTDNRTVSDTNLTKEYELYHKHFDSSVQDFYAHNKTAIEASFASDEEKEELLEKLAKAYS